MKRVIGSTHAVSPLAVVALVAAAGVVCVLVGCGGKTAVTTTITTTGAPSKTQDKFVLYSLTTNEQFLNHEDDRARGIGKNPFGFKDSAAISKETGTGPFAGDRAVFTFAVYKDANLNKSIGSATFICQYSFSKQALCDVSYLLKGGDMFGTGQFDFNATAFSVAITGGTGIYRSFTGDVAETPAPQHAQHLVFTLQ